MEILKRTDKEIYQALVGELKRQKETLELIASENYTSLAVLAVQGSVLTNKYAEGYPKHRYYGGCQFYDIIESLAIERAKKLFHAEHANVQPHSGTQANMSVYFAVLKPGNTLMGMHLAHGGHLSHGHPTSFSGQYFNAVVIGVDRKTELLNYDEIYRMAKKYRPHLIVAGSSSYSRVIDWKKIKEICEDCGAYFMADIAHYAGLIAAGIYPSPVKYAEFVTLTTHKTLRGPRGGIILCKKEYKEKIDKMVFPGTQGGPLMHVIAAKAVALKEAMSKEFKIYQQQVVKNAKALASSLALKGYRIVFGGTDTHMLLIDLRPKKLTGLEAEKILDEAGITVNKNSIPYDPEKPFVTSGIRLGTPALTTRGMKEKEMEIIAEFIDSALKNRYNKKILKDIKNKVKKLLSQFPIYQNIHYD